MKYWFRILLSGLIALTISLFVLIISPKYGDEAASLEHTKHLLTDGTDGKFFELMKKEYTVDRYSKLMKKEYTVDRYSKYFIISLNIGFPLKHSTQLVIDNHMNYSSIFNYKYKAFNYNDIKNLREFTDTAINSTWCDKYKTCYKVLIIHHIFTHPQYKNSFQYLLFMDADAYFVNFHVSLDMFLQRANLFHSQYQYQYDDGDDVNNVTDISFVWSRAGEIINAGVILWKNTPFIYDNVIKLLYNVMKETCLNDVHLSFHEQSILSMIIKGLTYDIWKDAILNSTLNPHEKANATLWKWVRRYCFYNLDNLKLSASNPLVANGKMDTQSLVTYCIHRKFHSYIAVLPEIFMNCRKKEYKQCEFIQHRSGGNRDEKIKYINKVTNAVYNKYSKYNMNQKQLYFVHIPKAAGTLIEDIAAKTQLNVLWGRFGWNHIYFKGSVEYQNILNYLCHRNVNQCCSRYLWHVPPSYILEYQQSSQNINNFTIYNLKQQTLFTVVRNPYTRLISIYWELHGKKTKFSQFCNAKVFNNWIRETLQNITLYPTHCVSFDNHLMPQWRYLYVDDNTKQSIVSHTIYFEKLQTEFNRLMESYNLSIQMQSKDRTNEHHTSYCDQVQLNMINQYELNMIQTVYKNDFILFGYDINDINITYN